MFQTSNADFVRASRWCQLVVAMLFSLAGIVSADDETMPPTPPRQRPGEEARPTQFSPGVYESVPDINSSASDFVPVPDRWRQFYIGKWYDPYNQNVLKGDLPIFGSQAHPWFLETALIADTVAEYRNIPFPVGSASTQRPNSNDVFGSGEQTIFVQNLIASFSLYQGNTTFKPQDFEFRVTPVFQYNYLNTYEDGVTRIDPSRGDNRDDGYVGFNELFGEFHLANISERYDFISSRIGIQRFNSDFRGFIFNDDSPGVRLFGNADNNQWQYNLGWFNRLNKDTNSGINTFNLRNQQVVVGNVYRQDFPVPGHTLQFNVMHEEDQGGTHYDDNGFLVRPAPIGDSRPTNVSSTYVGLTGDGHFDRINTTMAIYYVTGSQGHNPIAEQQVSINAAMAAAEISYDIDWIRLRGSLFWASGDRDPFDDQAQGFDAIFDNPNFAGGDLSFWQRQGIPLVAGGGVNLTSQNSLLANLRSNKTEGQSNFVNPGVRLYNLGIDLELTPTLKLVNNASFLQFDNPAVLRAVRQDGSINRNIGVDLSSGFLYRPFLNNNVQFRGGGAVLLPGGGLNNLYRGEDLFYLFTNMTLQY